MASGFEHRRVLTGRHGTAVRRPRITHAEVLPLITNACAGFSSSPESAAGRSDDGDYVRMLGVAMYALRRLAEGDDVPIGRLLEMAEIVLRDGDLEARELVEFGLIAELANEHLWPAGLDGERLLARVGPRARRAIQGRPWVRCAHEPQRVPSGAARRG